MHASKDSPRLKRVTPAVSPLLRSKNRHYSLATYILLRGVTLLIRTGNKQQVRQRRRWLYAVLAPTRFAHGDTALMCAACSQIIYGFIMMPQTLPASYVRFIRKQGAKDLYVWQGIRVSYCCCYNYLLSQAACQAHCGMHMMRLEPKGPPNAWGHMLK